MTDRPIIFSGPMVRALLEGRKTQTRRLAWRESFNVVDGRERAPSAWQQAKPGDLLWVREAFRVQQTDRITDDGGSYRHVCLDYEADKCRTWIKAYEREAPKILLRRRGESGKDAPLSPSMHMPMVASRLTLEVTATKIEPLLDISETDAQAESFAAGQLDDGFTPRDMGDGWTVESAGTLATAAGMFQITWLKLHPEWDGYSSPDVMALTFIVHKRNIITFIPQQPQPQITSDAPPRLQEDLVP